MYIYKIKQGSFTSKIQFFVSSYFFVMVASVFFSFFSCLLSGARLPPRVLLKNDAVEEASETMDSRSSSAPASAVGGTKALKARAKDFTCSASPVGNWTETVAGAA